MRIFVAQAVKAGMGRVGFRGRTRRYAFLLFRARSRAGVDGATPRRRSGVVVTFVPKVPF